MWGEMNKAAGVKWAGSYAKWAQHTCEVISNLSYSMILDSMKSSGQQGYLWVYLQTAESGILLCLTSTYFSPMKWKYTVWFLSFMSVKEFQLMWPIFFPTDLRKKKKEKNKYA